MESFLSEVRSFLSCWNCFDFFGEDNSCLRLDCVISIPTISHSLNYLAYMLILDNDSNAEVRRAVLSCIAMSPLTLPKVIKRTRDIKENVRVLAYQVLCQYKNT